MAILFASDIHGSVVATRVLLEKIEQKKPELVVLLGDHLYHGPRNKLPGTYDAPETARLLSSIGAPVMAIRGNCDAEVDQLLLPWTMTETGYLNLCGKPFFVSHGHQLPVNGGAWKVSPGYNFVFGHTHLPLAAVDEGSRRHIWNPGSLGIPKGGYAPSYGWYEGGVFKVLGLEGMVIAEDSLT